MIRQPRLGASPPAVAARSRPIILDLAKTNGALGGGRVRRLRRVCLVGSRVRASVRHRALDRTSIRGSGVCGVFPARRHSHRQNATHEGKRDCNSSHHP